MAQGTIILTNGSAAVAGVGTDFTSIGSGDFITTTIGGVPYTIAVAAVGSATALTLAIPFDGPTASGLAFENTGVNTMALATMGVTVQAQKALRFLIADSENWRKLLGNDQQITITTPGGQQITGISWGYLSQLLQNVDPALMAQQAQQAQDGANAAINANNAAQQAKNVAESAKDQAVGANNSAQQAKTAAETAETNATNARNQAEQFANSIDPAALMRKDANLSDVADKSAGRTNLGVGPTQSPIFAGVQNNIDQGAGNGGIVASNMVDGSGNVVQQTRLYHIEQGGIGKATIHVKAHGKDRFLFFDENSNLSGPERYYSAPGIGYVNQGGQSNDVQTSAPQSVAVNTWTGFHRYNWFSDYTNAGLVRGPADKISDYRIEVFAAGVDTQSYQFFPQGNLKTRAFNGRCSQGAWGTELLQDGNVIPFNALNVENNNGGWVPVVAGGHSTPNGYRMRVAFGSLSPGASGWGNMVLKIAGDTTYDRGYTFSPGGDISSWANSPGDQWGTGYTYTKAPTSDRDLKRDIVYTDGKESYDRVMQWLPTMFKYKWNDDQRFGLIAQDMVNVDPQYVKIVAGAPKFLDVMRYDEETGEEVLDRQIQTDEFEDDTLALDSNVMMADMACALVYMGGKLADLEARLAKLEK